MDKFELIKLILSIVFYTVGILKNLLDMLKKKRK